MKASTRLLPLLIVLAFSVSTAAQQREMSACDLLNAGLRSVVWPERLRPGVSPDRLRQIEKTIKAQPQFVLKDLNGRTVRLSDYQGKVVLINFWATWCPPCRAEMPDLVRLQREHGKEGLQIIGITYPPEKKARVRRFVRSLKVNYPIILGTRQLKARFSSEETLPLTVVINRDGKVSDIISGILLPQEFDEKIRPLLIKEK